MSKRGKLFLVIEIGSSKVSGVIGAVKGKDITVLSSDYEPTEGFTEGKVTDIEEAKRAIKTLIKKITIKGVRTPKEAFVLITGSHLMSKLSKGIATITESGHKPGTIGSLHIRKALEQAKQVPLPQNKEIVSVFPTAYYVDGEKVRRPFDMQAVRLEVDALILYGSTNYLRNIEVALLSANIKPKEYMYQPVMASYGVLEPEDRESGILLIDIGKDTTDIAVWIDGVLVYTKSLKMAGQIITDDISSVLKLRKSEAERLKIEFGSTDPDNVDKHANTVIETYGGERKSISKRELAEIMEATVEDIFAEVRDDLRRNRFIIIDKNKDIVSTVPVGTVIVGGTSLIPGIREVAKHALNMPAHHGKLIWEKTPDDMRTPAFASLWGAIEYMYRQIKEDPTGEWNPTEQGKYFWHQIKDFLKKNL